jgi:threonine/homoserine/homoserine lactone efflux protein
LSELPAAALLGFSIAASPGPVNALAVVRGLKHGASQAVLLALGATTADALYALLVVLGAGPFVSLPWVQVFLSLFGGLFLVRLGWKNLSAVLHPSTEVSEGELEGPPPAPYRTGFTIALLSPITIVFWMSVFGGYYAHVVAQGSKTPPFLIVAVLLLGATVWSGAWALMIHFGKKAIRGSLYRGLVAFLSLVLLFFALRLIAGGVFELARLLGPR